MTTTVPPVWPAAASSEAKQLLCLRVRCSAEELFQTLLVSDDLMIALHKARADVHYTVWPWSATREELPPDSYTWQAPAAPAASSPPSHPYRKVRFEGAPSALATKPFQNEENHSMVDCVPGQRYVMEARTTTSAPYGDKFVIYFRTRIVAETTATCALQVQFAVVWLPTMNFMLRPVVNKAIEGGVASPFRVMNNLVSAKYQALDAREADVNWEGVPPGSGEAAAAAAGSGELPPAAPAVRPVVTAEAVTAPAAAGAALAERQWAAAPAGAPARSGFVDYLSDNVVYRDQVTSLAALIAAAQRRLPDVGLVARAPAMLLTLAVIHLVIGFLTSAHAFCHERRGSLFLLRPLCWPTSLAAVVDFPDSTLEVLWSMLLVAAVNWALINGTAGLTNRLGTGGQAVPAPALWRAPSLAGTASASASGKPAPSAPPGGTVQPTLAVAATAAAAASGMAGSRGAETSQGGSGGPPSRAATPTPPAAAPRPIPPPSTSIPIPPAAAAAAAAAKAAMAAAAEGRMEDAAAAVAAVALPPLPPPPLAIAEVVPLNAATLLLPPAAGRSPSSSSSLGSLGGALGGAAVAAAAAGTAAATAAFEDSPWVKQFNRSLDSFGDTMKGAFSMTTALKDPSVHTSVPSHTSNLSHPPLRADEVAAAAATGGPASHPPLPPAGGHARSQMPPSAGDLARLRVGGGRTQSAAELSSAPKASALKAEPIPLLPATISDPQPGTAAAVPAAGGGAEASPAAPPAPLEVVEPATVIEETYENERFQPFRTSGLAWGHTWPGHFLPSDRCGHWSDRAGQPGGPTSMVFDKTAPALRAGWKWVEDEWKVDMFGLDSAAVDAEGWTYAVDFAWLKYPPGPGQGKCSMKDFVRRRRYFRTRVRIASAQPPAPLAPPPTRAAAAPPLPADAAAPLAREEPLMADHSNNEDEGYESDHSPQAAAVAPLTDFRSAASAPAEWGGSGALPATVGDPRSNTADGADPLAVGAAVTAATRAPSSSSRNVGGGVDARDAASTASGGGGAPLKGRSALPPPGAAAAGRGTAPLHQEAPGKDSVNADQQALAVDNSGSGEPPAAAAVASSSASEGRRPDPARSSAGGGAPRRPAGKPKLGATRLSAGGAALLAGADGEAGGSASEPPPATAVGLGGGAGAPTVVAVAFGAATPADSGSGPSTAVAVVAAPPAPPPRRVAVCKSQERARGDASAGAADVQPDAQQTPAQLPANESASARGDTLPASTGGADAGVAAAAVDSPNALSSWGWGLDCPLASAAAAAAASPPSQSATAAAAVEPHPSSLADRAPPAAFVPAGGASTQEGEGAPTRTARGRSAAAAQEGSSSGGGLGGGKNGTPAPEQPAPFSAPTTGRGPAAAAGSGEHFAGRNGGGSGGEAAAAGGGGSGGGAAMACTSSANLHEELHNVQSIEARLAELRTRRRPAGSSAGVAAAPAAGPVLSGEGGEKKRQWARQRALRDAEAEAQAVALREQLRGGGDRWAGAGEADGATHAGAAMAPSAVDAAALTETGLGSSGVTDN